MTLGFGLVEFHNLGTTTIEIPEGGHLFLLGDNGSGKTTVLDAIHLVLTGGREMEFNAAARVAGAKDSGGRTIQGVVLRYNAVTGRTAREAGITYAAVELRSDAGRVCSLAVGLSASGMDVAFDRWGGIASAPVAELPLTIEEDGRIRAATRGEFERGMKALQGGRYYAHNNDYADAVGARLFGGEAKYADVCKLLRTGKAYREIASRAANYDDLFRQLLEDPDRDTFEPLLKGLRELEDSKGRLDRIDERAQYLDELAGELARLGKLRLKEDLVSWAEAERSRSAAERKAVAIAGEESSEAAARKADAARGRERLAELRAKDRTGLIDREKSAAQRLAEAERRTGEAESALADAKRCADAAEKALREAQMRRASALAKCADGLAAAGKSAGCAVGGVVDALRGADDAAESDFAGLFGPLRNELDREQSARHEADILARKEADAAADEVGRCRAELDAIRSRGENLPDVPGFAEVRAEIREKMLAARPLYELLEPASGCDTRHLALLERLAGDDFLATWLANCRARRLRHGVRERPCAVARLARLVRGIGPRGGRPAGAAPLDEGRTVRRGVPRQKDLAVPGPVGAFAGSEAASRRRKGPEGGAGAAGTGGGGSACRGGARAESGGEAKRCLRIGVGRAEEALGRSGKRAGNGKARSRRRQIRIRRGASGRGAAGKRRDNGDGASPRCRGGSRGTGGRSHQDAGGRHRRIAGKANRRRGKDSTPAGVRVRGGDEAGRRHPEPPR